MPEILDARYDHLKTEERIYKLWEKSGYFNPDNLPSQKNARPFCIIMPPPNANGPLHIGHAFEVALQDLMIRYARMRGRTTLWLPGADHAGFETQVVFDKKLEKEGRSRFRISRQLLWREMWDFTQANKKVMEGQLRRLGASADWSREKFTLDPDIVKIVYKTFEKLYKDGLVYRDVRVVNWCPKHKTALSDLEVKYVEYEDPLYFIKYGPLTLATVRPETKFGDTALAVHPKDERYKKYVGKTIEAQGVLGSLRFKVIADEAVDPAFGTGVIKVTPAHDAADFEIWQRHKSEIPGLRVVIDEDGRLTKEAGEFAGLKVSEARQKVAHAMEKLGILKKVEPHYVHQVATCYKCGTTLEPLPKPQWFVKMKPLAKKAIGVVERKKIRFFPERAKKVYVHWLKNIRDWNISRQIVWGIRIPAYFCVSCRETTLHQPAKKMGFYEGVVPQILSGKTKTYRLRDHGLNVGDRVAFENSTTGQIFGYGTITNVARTTVTKINLHDKAHGATYKNYKDLVAAFARHHPDREVTPDTHVFIYTYRFMPLNRATEHAAVKVNPTIKSRWFIVRHGETDWNTEKRTQGHIDIPLNEEGRQQAQRAAEELRTSNIDLVISSDLARAKMTAEIIAKITGAELVLDKNLRERNLGITEGMLREPRNKMYGHLIFDYDAKPPQGESYHELEERVWRAFTHHKKRHHHKNVVIVTHGGSIRVIVKNLKNLDPSYLKDAPTPHNTAVTELVILKEKCSECGGDIFEQDLDVFDTWFSSGQWPYATLGYPNKKDFRTFYPTDVMAPGYEILFFWVARMIMLGLYRTGKIPFKTVYLHGMVRDKDRQKMSKSKGNVIDPLAVTELYGTDAVRMSFLVGTIAGNDPVISEDKIRGYRNFATKLWNIGRFILMNRLPEFRAVKYSPSAKDTQNLRALKKIKSKVTEHMEKFEFHLAAETLYHYVWHTFADKIVEQTKPRLKSRRTATHVAAYRTLEKIMTECLTMLHPFMPFVTEAIYEKFSPEKLLLVERW